MKLYELIAQQIEQDINKVSPDSPLYLKVDVDYAYMPPDERPEKIVPGILSFSPEDILPVSGVNILTLNADVSFVCAKEDAAEVRALCEAYIEKNNGNVTQISEYVAMPTFSTVTPSSEVIMAGQLGESEAVSFYLSYVLIKDGYAANGVAFKLDGKPFSVTSFDINKTRTAQSDNIYNNETLKSSAETQAIAFQFAAILTKDFSDITVEILSSERLASTHTLDMTLGDNSFSYTVLMQSGSILGEIGGLVNAQFAFVIAR